VRKLAFPASLIISMFILSAAAQNQGIGPAVAPGVSPDGIQKNLNTDDAGNLILSAYSPSPAGGGGNVAADGGIPVAPTRADTPTLICCGTGPTAMPYSISLNCQNQGPNEVFVGKDGGYNFQGVTGTATPATTPGGTIAFSAVGIPYVCMSPSGAQSASDAGTTANPIMVGCLSCDQTNQ
jgi:hypothetical protein